MHRVSHQPQPNSQLTKASAHLISPAAQVRSSQLPSSAQLKLIFSPSQRNGAHREDLVVLSVVLNGSIIQSREDHHLVDVGDVNKCSEDKVGGINNVTDVAIGARELAGVRRGGGHQRRGQERKEEDEGDNALLRETSEKALNGTGRRRTSERGTGTSVALRKEAGV